MSLAQGDATPLSSTHAPALMPEPALSISALLAPTLYHSAAPISIVLPFPIWPKALVSIVMYLLEGG